MPTAANPDVVVLLEQLSISATSHDCLHAANSLGHVVVSQGLDFLDTQNITASLLKAATNKKDGLQREGALLGFVGIANTVGKAIFPYFMAAIPEIIECHADKGAPVREAASLALTTLLSFCEPMAVPLVFPMLFDAMTKKWQHKVAALRHLSGFAAKAPFEIGVNLPEIIPAVSECMHDTKVEVSKAAISCMTELCKVVANPDIDPHISLLVDCMAHPDHVSATVTKLSSTTFVAEVTGPALAVMVPLLVRALNDRSAAVMRSTSVIANNLFKLVRNPADAAQFAPQLLPGLDRIIDAAAFPEVRALATEAKFTLVKSEEGALAQTNPNIISVSDVFAQNKKFGNTSKLAAAYDKTFDLVAYLVQSLIKRDLYDEKLWNSVLDGYLCNVLPDSQVNSFISTIYKHFNTAYENSQRSEEVDNDADGELLCACQFSLAYGGMMLLNHTRLRLRRGQRYGLCAQNGAGKSTLLRAISLGKVEGFPALDVLRTVFVEHTLQGDDGDKPILDFLASDTRIIATRSEISQALTEVGFLDDRQASLVSSLSGGWKMKLELARAMLMKADILLLDEPTNHLDVANIAWLENYLMSQPQVTSIIVSHDSSFLDNVCTYIIHYESKKLVYYKGNLSAFVERKPEAKSYYTLAATSVKFSFPPPSILLGIRSNTKAILKMVDGTYSYPNALKPSMMNVGVQLSLSSRVGIIGPNGAGKSTMIKLLTGEIIPQTGTVWKHPNIRIGYVAQHAFHHLEQHLEKTPVEYISWRYQGGQDREVMEKASRKMTDEDLAQMQVQITGGNGDKRRIEEIIGRQKQKKSFQYEVKWVGMPHKFNKWMSREELSEYGFQKIIQAFDDQEASREGQAARELIPSIIRQHIQDVGLPGDIADNNAISGLSGGQKVKVVLAAAMWNNPHMLVLDEPTNYLDREALGGLAVAIREWTGAVVMISHHTEFVEALCPEIWHVNAGILTAKGVSAVQDEHFEDSQAKIAKAVSKPKKKKLTKNEVKAQELRRRNRYLAWIEAGGQFSIIPREPDTDSD